ncbi:MAG: hypothetical protein EPO08_04890 [Rhodospirillaceae bacterium]|nr:MAG: hypothetical protein EPO08_04890 [Rhodospirillaceae bacterium]
MLRFVLDGRFLPVLDGRDLATAYVGHYDPVLVVTSLAISTLAALVALTISGRIVAAATRRTRWAWAWVGAMSIGGGIWATHFIGMLAFSLPCGITYDPVGTVLSMIPGVLASGVALNVLSTATVPNTKRLLVGAVFIGAGIVAMHYAGMAAMRPEALVRYDAAMIVVSFIVAIVLAFVALSIWVHFLTTSRMPATIAAAALMGCAMAGMHYTAMRAAIFFPLLNVQSQSMALSPTLLALLIALFTVLIALCTLAATFASRRNELALRLTAEVTAHKRDQERLVISMKAAEDANKAKTAFLANMAHELRTPLNAIIGFSEIMASGTFGRLPDKYADYASMIHESGTHLLAIINDILDTTNTETGSLTLQEARVDPREVVNFTSKIIGDMAAGAGITYSVDCVGPLPEVRADGAKLRQILINLLSNAIKFTPSGGRVGLTVRSTPERELEFKVQDNGIGIPAHMMAVALSPFGRIDSNLARRYGGVGLGLPLTKRLVELHGGTLEIDSVPHQGTIVTIRFPAWRCVQPDMAAEPVQ